MSHRGSDRVRRRRWIRNVLVGVVVVAGVAGLAAWLGTSWRSTYQQAVTVEADVSAVRSALDARQWDDVTRLIPVAATSVGALSTSTSELPWQLLTYVPFVGSTAAAVDSLAVSLDSVVSAMEPLTPFAQRIVDGDIRSADGAVEVAAMQEAAPLLGVLAESVSSSRERLAQIDIASVRPEVAGPVEDLANALADAEPAVATAAEIAAWMPPLLGANGPRNWLVLLQNPAEARGTGGFIGGYVLMRADKGRLSVASKGTSTDLGRTAIPAGAAPDDSALLWGNIVQAWNTYNVSPHFPLTAELSVAGMEARGESVTGVIAIDPAVVSALLEVTGPITADGVTITADNAEQFFTVDMYRQFPDNIERDKVTIDLVEATASAFLAGEWDPVTLIDVLREPVAEGRVRAWSAQAEEQAWLADSTVGGVLPDGPGPVIGVAFNNASGNKMDAFVQAEVDYVAGRCPTEPEQSSSLTIRLTNDAPIDLPPLQYGRADDPAAPAGSTNMLVHIYAPLGANYQSSTLDGVDTSLFLGRERNRPVWWAYVPVERGQTRELKVEFDEQMVLGVDPTVLVQPMAKDEIVTVTAKPTCDAS